MNTKKVTKIITVLLIVITVLGAISTVLGATIPTPKPPEGPGTTQLNDIAGRIIWIVQLICYAAAVIMLMVLGIKFITSSPEGKAEIKKSAVIYVVGAVLVFAAGILLGVIKNVALGITGNTTT